jgi:nicotinate-nucleotide--dimethylbenzimidazole phosphoribosyltransferase
MRIPEIEPVDRLFAQKAQKRWDNLTKPKGSLGRLEEIVCRLCSIRRTENPQISKKRLIVFAGDHGIVEEGVSAYPQKVTQQMVRGFLSGHAAICVLSRFGKIELKIVDAGIAQPLSHSDLIYFHFGNGTKNFLKEPALSDAQIQDSITAGIALADQAQNDGVDLLAGGDMGIGNTTSASAIFSALFKVSPIDVTGTGAGLSSVGRLHKIEIIQNALKKWIVDSNHPLEILRHFGGFEIACLTGLYLGAAKNHIPTIVDGFICTAAASIAIAIAASVKDYLFFAHNSAENGFSRIMEKLDVRPLLDLEMRLGEGTGAAIAMQLIEQSVNLYREMLTFEQAEVSRKIE